MVKERESVDQMYSVVACRNDMLFKLFENDFLSATEIKWNSKSTKEMTNSRIKNLWLLMIQIEHFRE